jgi:hypothetical protein
MSATKAKELLAAAEAAALPSEGRDGGPLMELARRHTSRAGKDGVYDMAEVLQSVPKKSRIRLCECLRDAITNIINESASAEAYAEEQEEEQEEGAFVFTGESLDLLSALATVVYCYATEGPGKPFPAELLGAATALHDILLHLDGMQGMAVQSTIAKICEVWWLDGLPGAESLVTQLVPYSLAKALDDEGKDADVKRVHALREALLLLDWDHEDSVSLREMLLGAFISSNFLRSDTGHRFLTCILGLHLTFSDDVSAVVRAQIPHARVGQLSAYGDVYFRAWQGSSGAYRQAIESSCVQPLMHAAAHASAAKLFNSLRVVLRSFHDKKTHKGVDGMLVKLYSPILWRGLKVANPMVRAHCVTLLADAFPLVDQEAPAEEEEKSLERQFSVLCDACEDCDHRVRSAAAAAVSDVLTRWWEALEPATARTLLTRIAGGLAWDASAPAVRLAAVRGMTRILQCPPAHGALRTMLPSTANLIHDTDRRVRRAYVALLAEVKGIRGMKFGRICQPDQMLAQLAQEPCPAVAGAVTGLLSDSYFPTGSGVTGEEQVSRMLTLVEQNPLAARVLCGRLREHTSVGSVTKLLVMLTRVIMVAISNHEASTEAQASEHRSKGGRKQLKPVVKSKGRKRSLPYDQSAQQGSAAEDEASSSPPELTAADTPLMSALLDLVASLWESVSETLKQDESYKPAAELVERTYGDDALIRMIGAFSNEPSTYEGVMRIAGLAGPTIAPGLASDAIVELRSLSPEAASSEYIPRVSLLCSWGMQGRLVEVVADALDTALDPGGVARPDSPGRKKRNRGAGVSPQMPVSVALSVLDYILAGVDAPSASGRTCLLADPAATSRLSDSLQAFRFDAAERLRLGIVEDDECLDMGMLPSKFLVLALDLEMRLQIHSSAAVAMAEEDYEEKKNCISMPARVVEIVEWSLEELLPAASVHVLGSSQEPNEQPRPLSPPPRAKMRPARTDVLRSTGEIKVDSASTPPSQLAAALLSVVFVGISELLALGAAAQQSSKWAQQWSDALSSCPTLSPARRGLLLPALCRLTYQLMLAEKSGAEVPTSLWSLLLDSAAEEEPAAENAFIDMGPGSSSAWVKKLLTAMIYLQSKRQGLEGLCGRLLDFIGSSKAIGSQNSPSDDGGSSEEDESDLQLRLGKSKFGITAQGSAVMNALVKSAPASSALGMRCAQRVLSRNGEEARAASHILAEAVERAPAKSLNELMKAATAEGLLKPHQADLSVMEPDPVAIAEKELILKLAQINVATG